MEMAHVRSEWRPRLS